MTLDCSVVPAVDPVDPAVDELRPVVVTDELMIDGAVVDPAAAEPFDDELGIRVGVKICSLGSTVAISVVAGGSAR